MSAPAAPAAIVRSNPFRRTAAEHNKSRLHTQPISAHDAHVGPCPAPRSVPALCPKRKDVSGSTAIKTSPNDSDTARRRRSTSELGKWWVARPRLARGQAARALPMMKASEALQQMC